MGGTADYFETVLQHDQLHHPHCAREEVLGSGVEARVQTAQLL